MIELKKTSVWVNWKLDPDKGKIPKNAKTGGNAQSNNPGTWSSYELCEKVSGNYDGVGFMFVNGVCGIDIDGADSDPERKAAAQDIIQLMNTYTEYSPSGTGYHIIFKCDLEKIPQQKGKLDPAYYQKNPHNGVECYFSGLTNRFFTYTGEAISDLDIEDRTEQILTFLDKYMKKKNPPQHGNAVEGKAKDTFFSGNDILSLARKAKNGNTFSKLYDKGDTSKYNGDKSVADLSLCTILAFWLQGDPVEIDRYFRQSALYRDKWEREDYRNTTIDKAIDKCNGKFFGEDKPTEYTSEENPDFTDVQWNTDYTKVMYIAEIDGKEQKTWVLMRKFFNMFPDKETRPKIEAISPQIIKENVIALLQHYKVKVKRNAFTEQIEIYKNGVYSNTLQLNEVYFIDIATKHRFKMPKTHLIACVVSIAWDNTYNPIETFLKQCHTKHKGKQGAIQRLCDTIQSDVPYKDEYITRWLVQAVALAVSADGDDTASHYMLVFQGAQGAGKTAWGQNLMLKPMQENYFLGGRHLDVGNKDHIMEQASRWIVELGEITSTFSKSDKEALKNYITTIRDVFRPPYWKETINKKRRVSFYGTVNDLEFLYDSTGSRRFLVIPTEKIDYMHNIDVTELWGEVYALYKSGYRYWFTPEECNVVTRRNAIFTAKTDTMNVIEEFYELYPVYNENEAETVFKPNVGKWLLARDIADHINTRVSIKEQVTAKTVGKQLKQANVLHKAARGNKVLFYLEELNDQREQPPVRKSYQQSKIM